MTLFLKIFLWFWLAIALLIGVFSLVSWTQQNEPVARQFRNLMSDAVKVQTETAAQIYRSEGLPGLNEYLTRLQSSDRIAGTGVFAGDGRRIAGDAMLPALNRVLENARGTSDVVFDRVGDETTAARKVVLADGSEFIMITRLRRPQVFAPDRTSWILRILAVILTGGLVCYGLARYLTNPIVRLRAATRELASGELSARIGEKAGRGRDELAELAREFDLMAERIESLVSSEKRLTRDISHELRSPLARLGVALELAKKKSHPEVEVMLQRIEIESARLNEMISRLLLLSKLENGVPESKFESVELKGLVADIVADADFEARHENKFVKFEASDDLSILGNEELVRSAVENVLRNAVRYTGSGTTVTVGLSRDGDAAIIVVEDYGGGVPEAELENLFRPFYRVGEARERQAGGVGLGLSIAMRAAEAHGGTIHAANTDHGLRVTVRLPRNGGRR